MRKKTYPIAVILLTVSLWGLVGCTNSQAAFENPTPSATEAPTRTLTKIPEPTEESVIELTNAPTPAPTDLPTNTPVPSPTSTPTPTPTNTPTPSPTSTPTPTPTNTPTPSPTSTPTPSPTNTPTPSPTNTPTPTPTNTPTPTPALEELFINADYLMGATVNTAVYTSPSETSKQIYKPDVGEELRITGEGTKEYEDWYRVAVNGTIGYTQNYFLRKAISDFPYPLYTLLEDGEYVLYFYHLDTDEDNEKQSELIDEAMDILHQNTDELMRSGAIKSRLTGTANSIDPNDILSEYAGVYIISIRLSPVFVKHDEHEFGEYIYNWDATTTTDGTKTAVCRFCGITDTLKAEGTKISDAIAAPEPPVLTLWFLGEDKFCDVTGYVNHKTMEPIRLGEVYGDDSKVWMWSNGKDISSYAVLQTYLNVTYGEEDVYWLPVNDSFFMKVNSEQAYSVLSPNHDRITYSELPFILYPNGDAAEHRTN